MPCVFINYRTNDEEASATLIDRELSLRFGSEKIFRASKSIGPGERFESALLSAVRRSGVLVAIIGTRWLTATDRQGGRALNSRSDWTRREIVEAFRCHIPVVPVLVGKAQRIEPSDLPTALADLASCQYRRLDHRNVTADLTRLADDLAKLVPELASTPRPVKPDDLPAADAPRPTVHMRETRQHRRGGVGSIAGNVGTIGTDSRGPVNTGSGHQYNLPPSQLRHGAGNPVVPPPPDLEPQ